MKTLIYNTISILAMIVVAALLWYAALANGSPDRIRAFVETTWINALLFW